LAQAARSRAAAAQGGRDAASIAAATRASAQRMQLWSGLLALLAVAISALLG
jgi:methyl-accepting chemotaxis protein